MARSSRAVPDHRHERDAAAPTRFHGSRARIGSIGRRRACGEAVSRPASVASAYGLRVSAPACACVRLVPRAASVLPFDAGASGRRAYAWPPSGHGRNNASGSVFGNSTFSSTVSPVLRPFAQFRSRNATRTPSTVRKSS